MTVEQIIEEVHRWPAQRVDELVDRLVASTTEAAEGHEQAWRQEIRRRVREIERGEVAGVPGEAVSERIRKLVGR